MPRFDPLFGIVSFEKAAKFISVFDLVLCCLYVLVHFVGGGYLYEQRSEEYEEDLSSALKEEEDPVNGSTPSPLDSPRPTLSLTFKDFQKLTGMGLPSPDIVIIMGLCAGIFAIFHICMEVWLCRLLLKAAGHKDGSALKIWFWCRLGITILFSLYSLICILTVQTDVLDYLCEGVNIYRMYTLYIVYEFKTHISACVNVVKSRET